MAATWRWLRLFVRDGGHRTPRNTVVEVCWKCTANGIEEGIEERLTQAARDPRTNAASTTTSEEPSGTPYTHSRGCAA